MKVPVFLFIVSFVAALAEPAQQTPTDLSNVHAQESNVPADVVRAKRSYDRWLDIIAQFGRRGANGGAGGPWQPFPVDLPVTGKDGQPSSLPVLVLPVPVPVPDPKLNQECEVSKRRGENDKYREDRYKEENRYRQDNDRYSNDRNEYRDDRNKYRGDSDRYRGDSDRYRGDSDRYRGDSDRYRGDSDRYSGGSDRYREDRNRYRDESIRYQVDSGRHEVNDFINRFRGGYENEEIYQEAQSSVSADYLIELFRAQQPTAPELPPALIDYAPEITEPSALHQGSGSVSDQRKYLPVREAVPPPPKFEKSMKLRGFLTVPRADYTEAYTAWYDASSGAARVDYHEGGASSFRTVSSDGRVKRSVMHTDRTTEKDIRMCGVTSPARMKPEDRAPPGLPNTDGFNFAGYKEEFGGRVEVWRMEVTGRTGELGAARGEALTYRHELLVSRKSEEFSIPLKYKVAIDSSVLGKDADGYEHVYSEVQEVTHRSDTFSFNPDKECEAQEELDARNVQHMARLEPLREFTLPHRDEHHDIEFEDYVKEFERHYDDKEAAMRKTLLIQSSRFISSCNRQSATFQLAANFLTDRLEAEIEVLLGAFYDAEAERGGLNFPVGEGRLISAEKKLPKEFDWRPRGGVTSVKFQGTSCASCWAFAVAGSVEGALFIKTSTLQELAEQCLVDCAHSHGAHGCNGTWPSHAYNYIKDRGIPARDEYTPYMAKVLKCRDKEVPPVTHINGYVDVPPNNINALKVAIRRFAPSVVVVDAKPKTFINYKKGVLQDDRCVKAPKKRLNHAVLAVGWGELRNAPHFILKNSWHEKWGDGGYIKVHAPSNTCGHLTTPSFARLRRADVDRLPAGAGADSRAAPDDDYEDGDDR